MKAIIRKDEQAVSPVIATILMVAITVVLAAVLYVMVSGLISGPGNTPKSIGVAVTKSGDGTNWILTFTSVPTGLSNTTTMLTVTLSSGGATGLTGLALSSSTLSGTTSLTSGVHAQYIPATTTGTVSAGDRVLLAVSSYPAGDGYSLTSSGSILASGTLS